MIEESKPTPCRGLAMKKVRILIPQVKEKVEERPRRCRYCKCGLLQGHGRARKVVKDLKLEEVEARRYRCCGCRRTFRHYPEGVSKAKQSRRLVALAALLWGLGLSHWNVSRMLQAMGCSIAKMTSWRDVQQVGGVLRRRMVRLGGKVEVIGADETVMKVRGKKVVLGFVVDAKRGETLGIEVLVEQDALAFVDWLRKYAEVLGARVVVSDDLSTYKPAVEELGLEHQVCLAHVRKNLTRRLKKIKGWDREKEKLKELVKRLSEEGSKVLLAMEKEVRDAPALRDVVVDMLERWRSLRCYQRVSGVPTTNNVTERAIGRSKIRYKTLRGYKSMEGMLNGLSFTQWLYRPRYTVNLGQVILA